jgi:hypothetical protein
MMGSCPAGVGSDPLERAAVQSALFAGFGVEHRELLHDLAAAAARANYPAAVVLGHAQNDVEQPFAFLTQVFVSRHFVPPVNAEQPFTMHRYD